MAPPPPPITNVQDINYRPNNIPPAPPLLKYEIPPPPPPPIGGLIASMPPASDERVNLMDVSGVGVDIS